MLEESELTEKRAFIKSFVNIVEGEATLTYTMPINGILERKIGVLPIEQDGGH